MDTHYGLCCCFHKHFFVYCCLQVHAVLSKTCCNSTAVSGFFVVVVFCNITTKSNNLFIISNSSRPPTNRKYKKFLYKWCFSFYVMYMMYCNITMCTVRQTSGERRRETSWGHSNLFMAYAVSQTSWISLRPGPCHLGDGMGLSICCHLWKSSALIWINYKHNVGMC